MAGPESYMQSSRPGIFPTQSGYIRPKQNLKTTREQQGVCRQSISLVQMYVGLIETKQLTVPKFK